MTATDEWDYRQVPADTWSWYVKEDPSLRCPADKTVELTRNGLSYFGDCHHPNWGGGYTIGSQTFEQFLGEGPLAEQMPAETAAAIRQHLLDHRRPGGRAELILVANVVGAGHLERVDCSLDGAHLTTRRQTEPGQGPHVFFEGAVTAGDHLLRAALIAPGCGRPQGIAYANDVRLRVEAGSRLRATFEVTADGATVTTTTEQLE